MLRNEISERLTFHQEAFTHALDMFHGALARHRFEESARHLNESATHAAICTELRAMLAALKEPTHDEG